jgi:hypothetical protein
VCKKPGHFAKHCTKDMQRLTGRTQNFDSKPNSSQTSYEVSALTKSFDVDKSLPVIFGKLNNNTVNILHDSGSTIVLVRKDLLNPNQILNEHVEIKFANNSSVTVPKVKIHIKCPYYTGNTVGACLDDHPFDVLLGNIPGASMCCSRC